MVVLTGRTPVQQQCGVRLLDHPPLRLRDEAFALVGPIGADDLDSDVQPRAVDDDFALEALVHPGLLQTHPAPLGGLVEQGGAGGIVASGSGQHDDANDQPQHVDGQSPLAPGHLLVGVQSRRDLGDTGGRAHGLGVKDDERRVL